MEQTECQILWNYNEGNSNEDIITFPLECGCGELFGYDKCDGSAANDLTQIDNGMRSKEFKRKSVIESDMKEIISTPLQSGKVYLLYHSRNINIQLNRTTILSSGLLKIIVNGKIFTFHVTENFMDKNIIYGTEHVLNSDLTFDDDRDKMISIIDAEVLSFKRIYVGGQFVNLHQVNLAANTISSKTKFTIKTMLKHKTLVLIVQNEYEFLSPLICTKLINQKQLNDDINVLSQNAELIMHNSKIDDELINEQDQDYEEQDLNDFFGNVCYDDDNKMMDKENYRNEPFDPDYFGGITRSNLDRIHRYFIKLGKKLNASNNNDPSNPFRVISE